jgi:ABC-2 type transport system ATP-binding protein
MVQRVGLTQALMNDPDLLLLDEPMSGLDPLGRRLVRNLILEQRGAGKTVLFSTHILPDAETLCDRVAVLRAGRLIRVGALGEILQLDVSHMEVLVVAPEGALPGLAGETRREQVGDRVRLEVEEGSLGEAIAAVERTGGRILGVQPVRQSLEDYFYREMAGGREEEG